MADFDGVQTAFNNRQTVLVRGNDARCVSYWAEDDAGHEQQEDGPTYIVIGRGAPDGTLVKLAQRYGYALELLQAFRDGPGNVSALQSA
jgi:hypothetical protein